MPGKSVLVVDDEDAYLTVMRDILSSYGLRVTVAHDAAQALRLMEFEPPSLFIVDVMMPDVDGLQLIRSIRNNPQWARIPVIVASARAMPEEREEAFASGATAFIAKPFTAKELRSAIRPHVSIPPTAELKRQRRV
ncbi:MAG: response regulator [Chloroflexota bacterium]